MGEVSVRISKRDALWGAWEMLPRYWGFCISEGFGVRDVTCLKAFACGDERAHDIATCRECRDVRWYLEDRDRPRPFYRNPFMADS